MKTCPIDPLALLIDLDGTLADSLSVMREAYQVFLDDFQVCGTDAEFASLNGPPLKEVVRRLKVTHGLTHEVEQLTARYFEIIDRLYGDVSPTHGARQLLSTAQSQNCRVAVVTSNSSERTSAWLSRVGLTGFVDFIVSGEQVKYGKPDPEPYLLASQIVDCPVDRIVAIEDSVPVLSLEHIAIDLWGGKRSPQPSQ